MQLILAAARARLAAQEGITMITTMLSLFVLGLLSVAAISAANGDINLSRYDQDEKQAQAAAEAGINDYFAHLQSDSDYWTRCAGENPDKPLGAGHAVNQRWSGTGADPRNWRNVSNANSQYTIELIPAPGQSACNPTTNTAATMIDGGGNFRVRATGRVNGTDNYQSVVATFRRTGFLDFIYFTDYENQDPTYIELNFGSVQTRETDANGNEIVGGPTLQQWAGINCDRHWWGDKTKDGEGRGQYPTWRGQLFDPVDNRWEAASIDAAGNYNGGPAPASTVLYTASVCSEIRFASDDQVNGPFHSNDDILIDGTPDFGRLSNADKVEVANLGGSDVGWRGSGTPNFRTPSGKLTTGASSLNLPPGNSSIKTQAQDNYRFSGPTDIVLDGTDNTMDITNGGTTTSNVPVPSNGVIYVQNAGTGTCTFGYRPQASQTYEAGCGIAKVSGTYGKDLTIGAQDDVVIMGDLQRVTDSDAVLGLVAEAFVRVSHPVTPLTRTLGGSCTNSNSPMNVKIDAAILSLKHSFTVDNYDCGAKLGTLTVNGAIAQKHRGIVGTGGSGGTGYIKNYTYDDRLRYRSPPYFLDPVQASWRILRQNDQAGSR